MTESYTRDTMSDMSKMISFRATGLDSERIARLTHDQETATDVIRRALETLDRLEGGRSRNHDILAGPVAGAASQTTLQELADIAREARPE